MRVLIADDDDEWRELHQHMLRRHLPTAEYVEVGTMDELRAAARTGQFDLVLKDCTLNDPQQGQTEMRHPPGLAAAIPMPLTRGDRAVRTIEEMRALGLQCPIIVVSGDSEVVRRSTQGGGADGGCTKGDVPQQLPIELRRLGLIS